MSLDQRIDALFDSDNPRRTPENLALLAEFRAALNRGAIRAAEPTPQGWKLHVWVKKGILLHRALGILQGDDRNFDLDTMPERRLRLEDSVRLPSGGSHIRDGSYLAPGVACMPPLFVNLGAWIGPGSVLDSHVTVGVCVQIGDRVHISTGSQIGGLIEPLDAPPTIISDDVLIGGNCGIYDGVCVGPGAVLAAGVILTRRTRVYDAGRLCCFQASDHQPLTIPALAIVVPGARPITKGPARRSGLMIQVPIIVGYRDEHASDDVLASLLD